jgi:hypothetical protein
VSTLLKVRISCLILEYSGVLRNGQRLGISEGNSPGCSKTLLMGYFVDSKVFKNREKMHLF